jgi:hypothetical protein
MHLEARFFAAFSKVFISKSVTANEALNSVATTADILVVVVVSSRELIKLVRQGINCV